MYLLFDIGHEVLPEGHKTHVPNITRFTNCDGNCYGNDVLRDFLRYETVEHLYERYVVNSVNICEDNLQCAPFFSPQQYHIDFNIRIFPEEWRRRSSKFHKLISRSSSNARCVPYQ